MRAVEIKDPIEEVEYQLEIADAAYEDNIKGKSLDKILALSEPRRQQFMYQAATICELYLKGLAVWKGHSWNALRGVGHSMQKIFDILDEEGKKILTSWYNIQPKKRDSTMKISSHDYDETLERYVKDPLEKAVLYHGATPENSSISEELYNEIISKKKHYEELEEELLQYESLNINGLLDNAIEISLRDGNYERRRPPRSELEGINDPLNKVMELLKAIKPPQYRYSEKKFIFTNEEIALLFDFTKKVNWLSKSARDEKKSIDSKMKKNNKK